MAVFAWALGLSAGLSACGGGTAAPAASTSGPAANALPLTAPPATGDYGQPISARSYPERVADDAPDGHPRLWIREADLARLRAWARSDNPTWAQGLAPRLADARALFDRGELEKKASCGDTGPYCEGFAALFAVGSLVDPDEKARAADAKRGRQVLVDALKRIDARRPGDPFSDPRLATFNRSRWVGESFALAVDYLYPHLDKSERALARKVFLRWAEELLDAITTTHNHPEPRGVLVDDRLLANRSARRYALNNYYAAHARNLGLMAMALDPADDPAEPDQVRPKGPRTYPNLRSYLDNVAGAWWFVADHALADDARGGVSPEGAQYGPQMLAYYAQLAWAAKTAGVDMTASLGPRARPVTLGKNAFWGDLAKGYLHFVTPGRHQQDEWIGPVHQLATSGDGERYGMQNASDLWAAWGLEGALRGDFERLEAARWIVRNLPSPDEKDYRYRLRGDELPRSSLDHFLLMDPDAPPPRDPRPRYGLSHRAEGTGWLFARTGWDAGATAFGVHSGFALIDHQHGDGGDFFLYRKGEFVTKERSGYGILFESTHSHNAMTVENAKPSRSDQRRDMFHREGSQWVLSHDEDPVWLAAVVGPDAAHAAFDNTGLYNSSYEEVTEVTLAQRSVTWLAPDAIVVVDRVATKAADRKRRAHFHFPSKPVVAGRTARVVTPKGQHARVDALLPTDARLSASTYKWDGESDTKLPRFEPMQHWLSVEPGKSSGAGEETVFVHVLSVGDVAPSAPVELGAVEGDDALAVRIGGQLLIVPSLRGPSRARPPAGQAPSAPTVKPISPLKFTAPAGASKLRVFGLQGGQRHALSCDRARKCTLTLEATGPLTSGAGGELTATLP